VPIQKAAAPKTIEIHQKTTKSYRIIAKKSNKNPERNKHLNRKQVRTPFRCQPLPPRLGLDPGLDRDRLLAGNMPASP